MDKKLYSLQTPCGDIRIEDSEGNLVPFIIKRNTFDCDYDLTDGKGPQKLVTTDTNYLIVIDTAALRVGTEYSIFLTGTKLNFGCSDEHTECVSVCSNGYCIALGCFSPNDDRKLAQAEAYSKKQGYSYIQMLTHYDESRFFGYDVEMKNDYSGFEFHLIDYYFSEISFPVAWIKCETGCEDDYEGAVQFWTT